MTDNDLFLKELRQRADRAHKSTDRADDAPPELWQRVRVQTKTEEEESSTMSSITLPAGPAPFSQPVAPAKSRGVGHYANLAATIAIVIGVALAGWFATMQLNQPQGDFRFAMLPGTPEVTSTTCDVEPMTLDEVMEIVENPYKYAEAETYGSPNSSYAPWYHDYEVVQPMVSESLHPNYGTVPTETAMEQALPVLDQYLACMETGTIAQALRFVDPFSIQAHVTDEFPFYRSEVEVRAYVSEWIESGPWPDDWHNEDTGVTLTFSPNRNTDEARTEIVWLGLGFNQLLYIGSNVMDEQGNQLARHDAVFQDVDGEQQEVGVIYRMVYSDYTEQWYVVVGDWPMKSPL